VIAVDTNILARFFCDDPDDPEAARQRPMARKLMLGTRTIFVPATVVLEFEWVMRGFYEVERDAFCATIDHLLGMSQVVVERWQTVQDAIAMHRQGLDFADALHLASSASCERLVSFDDRGFARRAKRLRIKPDVVLPD